MQKTFLWKNSTPKIKHGLFVIAIWPEDLKMLIFQTFL